MLPLEKGVGGILKQTTFYMQVTFGNENFMLGPTSSGLKPMPGMGIITRQEGKKDTIENGGRLHGDTISCDTNRLRDG